MARTYDDIEFHLIEVIAQPSEDSLRIERTLAEMIRKGDAAFVWEGRPYIALVCNEEKAARAAVRLEGMARSRELPARLSFVEEPYPDALKKVADRVISGWVKVFPRRSDDDWIG